MNFFGFFRRPSKASGKSKRSTLQFQGREVTVIRRAHRRTMTIRMKPHEPLRVTTALKVTDAEILRFLAKKAKWIQKNMEHFEKIPAPPVRLGMPGETWLYQGRALPVKESVTVTSKAFVKCAVDSIQIYWPEKHWSLRQMNREKAKTWIEASLWAEAEKLINSRVEFYSKEMSLKPARVKLMRARTRWGSCSSRGNLNFHWKLIGAPLDVVDAIVVHELAHLRHLNHSKDFWSLVEKYAPRHDEADRWLRENQHLL